jgi:hypothetical protein
MTAITKIEVCRERGSEMNETNDYAKYDHTKFKLTNFCCYKCGFIKTIITKTKKAKKNKRRN